MVRAAKKSVKPRRRNDLVCSYLIQKDYRRQDNVLKSYCVLQAECENITTLFPPETDQARFRSEVSLPTL